MQTHQSSVGKTITLPAPILYNDSVEEPDEIIDTEVLSISVFFSLM